MKKLCFVITFFVMGSLCVQAQLGSTNAPNYNPPTVVPPTPEVASLQKFAETPISYHTGVPNISIPIANLPGRELSASVSISYHAGGHRVNEESTWVGLGWSLSAGGQVTRTVRGIPDDTPTHGYINTQYTVESALIECSKPGPKTDLCKDMTYANGTITQVNDYEPDEFSFSGLGASGRFMFDQRSNENTYGRIIQFEGRGAKIEPIFGTLPGDINVPDKIIGWTIIDTQGNRYNYQVGNRFIKSQYFPIKDGAIELCESGCGSSTSYTETWDLQSVVSQTGDSIAFEYIRPSIRNWANRNEANYSIGEEKLLLYTGASSGSSNTGTNYSDMPRTSSYTQTERSFTRISKIITSQGSIEFIASQSFRQDTQTEKKSLASIEVRDNFNNLIKKVNFVQGYFQSPESTRNQFVLANSAAFNIDTNSFLKRLYLQKVEFEEILDSNSTAIPKTYDYSFAYNTDEVLPDKHSLAQDHWGFYNGADSNESLIPGNISDINFGHVSNREVNSNFTQANMLKEITFPEGGRTVFTYENNSKGVIDPGNAIRTTSNTINAIPSNPHTITTSANTTTYVFTGEVTISNDATSYQGDPTKAELNYDGFTTRCADQDQFYNPSGGDGICTRMFFRIFKDGQTTPIVSNQPIWRMGNVVVDKGSTYRVEIEMTVTSTNMGINGMVDDYDFNQQSTYVELTYNQNTVLTPYEDYLGGIRVSDVKNYDHTGDIIAHKSYTYEKGYALSKPTYLRVTHLVQREFLGNSQTITSVSQTLEMVSQSWVPLISTQAKYQGYQKVKEILHEVENREDAPIIGQPTGDDNYYTITRTYLAPYGYAPIFPGAPYEPLIDRSNLKTQLTEDKQITTNDYFTTSFRTHEFLWGYRPSVTNTIENFSSSLLSSGTGMIAVSGLDNSIQCGQYSDCKMSGNVYQIAPNINLLSKQSVQMIEQQQDTLTQVSQTFYESIPNHYNPTKTISVGSDGKVTEQRNFYPHDVNNGTLIAENRINTLMETVTIKDSIIRMQVRNDFALDGGNYLPKSVNAQKFQEVLTTNFGMAPILEERLVYHSYNANGKVQEVSQKDGTHIVYIWGYGGTVPVAKIENATYSQVASYVANIESLSNQDNDRTQGNVGAEGALRTALNNLRAVPALSKAMITTLTYDPLIGTTSVTDPRGNVIYYNYDGFHRLISVKDRDGNIVSENTYHYKN